MSLAPSRRFPGFRRGSTRDDKARRVDINTTTTDFDVYNR